MPAGGLANRGFVQTTYGSYYSTTQGEPSWALVDLDGDGKLDLVVTSENVIPDGSYYDSQVFDVGSAPHWQLYRNTGAGFAAQASNWAVPVGGLPNRGFVQTTYGSFYSTSQGEQSWTLVDVDGDRKPDLVVTSENTVADGSYFDSQVFGGTTGAHWQVYLNTGSGFAAQATNWTVPTGGLPNRGFVQTNYGSYYSTSQGEQSWSLVDLDLDGKPDLVATSENVIADGSYFDSQVFGGSASPHWQFYRNTGSGFATQAVDWPLPSGGLPGRGFVQTGYGTFYSTTQGEQSWALTDLDGDRRPDLVVTSENAIPNGSYYNSQVFDVGSAPHWQVYRNTGSGFAAQAASWTVPVGGLPNRGFVQTTYGSFYSTDQNEQSWALVDLDHDGLADLVATSEDVIADGSYFDSLVMGGTSSAHWALYRNTGAGFAVRSQDWTVPAGGLPNRGFVQTTYGSFYSTAQSEQSWALIDLDADAVLDLVVTSENVVQDGSYFDSQVFGGVGAPHWLVYRGQ